MKKFFNNLPASPGVYFFKDKNKKIIYIGKAKDLSKRVSSYFRFASHKSQALIKQVVALNFKQTKSEIEALILEANLIKKHQPKYNVKLKDDKSFCYIVITDEEWPRVVLSRNLVLSKNLVAPHLLQKVRGNQVQLFGPFTRTSDAKILLKLLKKVFPYLTSKRKLKRPCLQYHFGRCMEPCLHMHYNTQTQDKLKIQYKKIIKKIIKFLQGDFDKLISQLKRQMQAHSKKHNFEQAGKIRNQIKSLENVREHRFLWETHPQPLSSLRQSPLSRLRMSGGCGRQARGESFEPLKSDFHGRIEGYDISNLQGTSAVGSRVVFIDGEPEKAEYRRYKIKTVKGANDAAMLQEVAMRRFRKRLSLRQKREFGFIIDGQAKQKYTSRSCLRLSLCGLNDFPDLILIDGGKPQLNAVLKVMSKVINNITMKQYNNVIVVALAKKKEELYIARVKKGSIKVEPRALRLPRSSPALQLFQRVRDEAHRFALGYHRKLRSKEVMGIKALAF